MQGIIFALDQVGQLAQHQAERIAELEAENAALKDALTAVSAPEQSS